MRTVAWNRLAEGMWTIVTFPTGQHLSGPLPLPQRAAQPETAFHFLCSCPSRAQKAPPDAFFKFCQHLSPHTLSSQTGPFKQLIQTNSAWAPTASGGQEDSNQASIQATPALGQAGGASSSALGAQATPLPVGWHSQPRIHHTEQVFMVTPL